ncbi:tetratricopeptide repeat protein [Anabaena sp. FACHB-1237]|uniref:tetratricopeptide repeat protein n=1 Tax=Anabaena sp. FACHB-1237 TaxID=2692769 RepID=UPI001680975E|nr:tetratricopeptide repeat protein [Anabaena sp. FACHB-1237]MBD2136179.1 tetratricopeptide repeat protein [Anabaena sp. FACHB-1237]
MNNCCFLGCGCENHQSCIFAKNANHSNNYNLCQLLNNHFISPKESQYMLEEGYLRSYALQLAKEGNYATAIALLSHLIAHHPDNAIDYNNRGLIYFQSGDNSKALSDYNKALDLNCKLVSAYNNRANYYAACGQLNDALADYEQALDLNPRYVRAWINKGITFRDLEKYSDAIESLEVALLFGQLEGNIWAERGRTYHLWGDWNCAIADYRRALEKLPLSTNRNSSGYRLRFNVDIWLNELLFFDE